MNFIKTTHNRRSYLKATALSGGGLMLGFNWEAGYRGARPGELPANLYDINAFLQIARDGTVTIKSPDAEIDQYVTTSIPGIVAEELDVARDMISIHRDAGSDASARAGLEAEGYHQSGWNSLRVAGATARRMLLQAAANRWNIPVSELTTDAGTIFHPKTGRSVRYGEIATDASRLQIPEEVTLKDLV